MGCSSQASYIAAAASVCLLTTAGVDPAATSGPMCLVAVSLTFARCLRDIVAAPHNVQLFPAPTPHCMLAPRCHRLSGQPGAGAAAAGVRHRAGPRVPAGAGAARQERAGARGAAAGLWAVCGGAAQLPRSADQGVWGGGPDVGTCRKEEAGKGVASADPGTKRAYRYAGQGAELEGRAKGGPHGGVWGQRDVQGAGRGEDGCRKGPWQRKPLKPHHRIPPAFPRRSPKCA